MALVRGDTDCELIYCDQRAPAGAWMECPDCEDPKYCVPRPYFTETCVATDAAVCDAVAVDGNPATCTGVTTTSGTPCVHSPAADPDGVPGSGDETAESCEAADEATCAGKVLDGTAEACTTGGGDCDYTPPSAAVEEACDPPACAFASGDAGSCTGTVCEDAF